MQISENHETQKHNPIVFEESERVPKEKVGNITSTERALLCLSHFLSYSSLDKNPISILEVGPLPTHRHEHIAPISLFERKFPDNRYLGVGGHSISADKTKDTMGNVPFMEGLIFGEGDVSKDIINYFNDKLDIVYGRHVFENSSAGRDSFPLGRRDMLDGVVKLMKEGGYIIMDNGGGEYHQTLRSKHEPYAKHLKLYATYAYELGYSEETGGIYIFQKPIGSDAEGDKEYIYRQNMLNYSNLSYAIAALLKEREGIASRSDSYPIQIKNLQKRLNKIPNVVKKLSQQIENILKKETITPQLTDAISLLKAKVTSAQEDEEKILKQIGILEMRSSKQDFQDWKEKQLGEINSKIQIMKLEMMTVLDYFQDTGFIYKGKIDIDAQRERLNRIVKNKKYG